MRENAAKSGASRLARCLSVSLSLREIISVRKRSFFKPDDFHAGIGGGSSWAGKGDRSQSDPLQFFVGQFKELIETLEISRRQSGFEPMSALDRGAMGKVFGAHVTRCLLLKRVVADLIGRIDRFGDITFL